MGEDDAVDSKDNTRRTRGRVSVRVDAGESADARLRRSGETDDEEELQAEAELAREQDEKKAAGTELRPKTAGRLSASRKVSFTFESKE